MDKKLNKKKRVSPSVSAFIGAIITLVGGFFLSYNYVMTKKVMAYEYMNNVFNSTGESLEVNDDENLIKEKADKASHYFEEKLEESGLF